MPTGHHGGFQSLDEVVSGSGFNCTAKEGIDIATEEIVMQVCDNPERYDKIYYGLSTTARTPTTTRT